MGAAYGSLLASKMLFGGHKIHHVCLPAEADLINAEGFRVRLPVRGRKDPVVLDSHKLPGKVTAGGAAGVNPKDYDLVGLAMQEPQYRSPGVRELLDAVAKSRVPCMSIMNMPPLPYVKRIPGLDYDALKPAYTDPTVWDNFDPGLLTLCSPDPQAIRPPDEKVNVLLVTLPTNFKVREVRQREGQRILRQLEKDIDAVRFDPRRRQDRTAGEAARARLDLRAARQMVDAARRQLSLHHQGRHAHRARKRCTPTSKSRARCTISCSTSASSSALRRPIWCRSRNMPPRRRACTRPASAARALQNGAHNIERADKLVQLIAKQKGLSHPVIDAHGRAGRCAAGCQPQEGGGLIGGGAAPAVSGFGARRHVGGRGIFMVLAET